MLRVLRPGGWLLTSGDPFRPDHAGDEHELEVFERHPAVLLGVNESIPTLEELVATLVSHQESLDVELNAGRDPQSWRKGEAVGRKTFPERGTLAYWTSGKPCRAGVGLWR